MKQWLIIAAITIFASGLVFFTLRMKNLQTQLTALQLDYRSLESRYTELDSSYQSLQSNYESLRSDYDILQGRIHELQSGYSRLEAENKDLRSLLEQYEKVPLTYYSSGVFPRHSNTYEELRRFLIYEFTLPTVYKANLFDCSESSAYLEWALENAGFDAHIAFGPIPDDPDSGYHAWVIVYTERNQVAIEATALTSEHKFLPSFRLRPSGIIYSNDPLVPGWYNYYEGYDNLFQNIYQAIHSFGTTEEWNWWEGYWGFR
jgi:hypothetical protein